MFDICEFCKEVTEGSRHKRLPFGSVESTKALVILIGDKDYDATQREVLEEAFPGAKILYSYACHNVDMEDARVGCGIWIRNLITTAKVIVLPTVETERFFGKCIAGVEEYKTGQVVIGYEKSPVNTQIKREFERVMSQT